MIFRLFNLLTVLTLSGIILAVFSACSKNTATSEQPKQEPIISTTEQVQTEPTQTTTSASTLEDSDTYIILDNEKTTINGYGASFENNTVTITDGGTYHISGIMTDGKIFVNSKNETKKVKLILSGVNISCSTDAPLFVENSPEETILILDASTENIFSDTARTVPEDTTDYATAAIYSKDDLQIEGDGSLTVYGNFNKGIFSKNDIDIHGGNITIQATDDGIRGKDSVEIEAGIINIVCGGDGIRTNEETQEDKGDIEINSGIINITCDLDGIQATGNVTVNGGQINITAAGGSTVSTYSEGTYRESYNKGAFPFNTGKNPESSIYEDSTVNTPSTKSIKADKAIVINNGTFNLNSVDDCIHAPEVTLNGGEITASSDDDGIHADENTTVNNGSINITSSYEGIEGRVININGGYVYINSSDDGFNAASPSEASSTNSNNRHFGGGMFENDESCKITMTDGFVYINAQGDGIDSNGSIDMSGGKIIVFGPTNAGNGALDYGGTYTISGGTLLACGSLGMAQSVTGNGVRVLNFNYNATAGSFYAITDSNNNCKIAFTTPKAFQNVVFASDTLSYGDALNFCQGGSISYGTEEIIGLYFNGIYSPGTVVGTLS